MGKTKGNGGRQLRTYEREMAKGTPKRLAKNVAHGGERQETTLAKPKK